MPRAQVFLSHVEADGRVAKEISVLIETALSDSRMMDRGESVTDSDVLLLLCGAGAAEAQTLREDVQRARDRAIPIIPIVHGSQRLDALAFPPDEPVSLHRGLEFHDQMFAIKLLLVVQEALGGERLADRGSAPRA